MSIQKVHLHNEKDNIAVALENLEPGDMIVVLRDGKEEKIPVKENISFGHKIALEDIDSDERVIKYGRLIGVAKKHIEAGEHVHVHNLRSLKYT